MLQVIILCLALCTDAFVASICYGADGIRIDYKRMGMMSGISSACLGAALLFGTAVRCLLPDSLTRAVCFVSLLLLGMIRLADSLLKLCIRRCCGVRKNIHFSLSGLQFILTIYGDPSAADQDRSRTLSLRETVFFGIAMSLDSLAAGAAAAFLPVSIPAAVLASFAVGCAAMCVGQWVGARFCGRLRWDPSWIGGIFFLLLAFSRLKG